MPIRPLRALVLLSFLVSAAACGLPGHQHPVPRRRPLPALSPALAKSEFVTVLDRYETRLNVANRQLEPQFATVVLTGSALQLQVAKYKIAKVNGVPLTPHRYVTELSAGPRFATYPRWFFAVLRDQGNREMTVFVQDREGAQWRAAYTPVAPAGAGGPLATGVQVAASPDVPAPGDASLALAPERLAGAVADLLNNGRGSTFYAAIRTAPWAVTARQTLGQRRTEHVTNGWSGTAAYAAAPYPVYAVRTTSGGALVWAAVDLKASYRHLHPGNDLTWRSAVWGDLLMPFIGRTTAVRSLTTAERYEFLAYVPPRGAGQVRFLADRWFPYLAQGG